MSTEQLPTNTPQEMTEVADVVTEVKVVADVVTEVADVVTEVADVVADVVVEEEMKEEEEESSQVRQQLLFHPCPYDQEVFREQFKKDYKLSCPVLNDEDIFAKSLKIAGLEQDWVDYLKLASSRPNLEDYRRKLRNTITRFIQQVPGFNQLGEMVNPYGPFTGPRTYLSRDNVGKRLVSIDLIQGNFQSLRFLGTKYVLDTSSYDELIHRFTQEPSLTNSKYFRQMVFGLLKPNVQASVQRMMIGHFISHVVKRWSGESVDGESVDTGLPIRQLTNDEVVFEISSDADLLKLQDIIRGLPYQYRLEEFSLKWMTNSYDENWFVRIPTTKAAVSSSNTRIMGVHVKYLFQVYNHINRIKCTDKDFWWRERGRLCMLLEPEMFE